MAILSLFISLFFIPHLSALDPYTKFTKLNLPPGPTGPESVTLDQFKQGPYVGVSDGRILKYKGPDVGFVDFAYTSPNRTKQFCDGVTDPNLGPICGRPFGLTINTLAGIFYIVDTFLGLFSVGLKGGLATLLANSSGDGVPFNFLNGVDVNSLTGEVVFTDGSQLVNFRNITSPNNPTNDTTGRLLKYNPRTKQVTVLLAGLPVPNGPVFSLDSTFVLFSSFTTQRVLKYWLVGPKANTTEVLLNLPGNPIKIKRASTVGEFWVAVNIIVRQPRTVQPFGYKFNSFGEVLLIKDLRGQYNNIQVNVVQEDNINGTILFTGSREVPYVGIYSKW